MKTPSDDKRKRFSIYLDPPQWEVLQRESERTGAPIAELIRRTIRDRYPVDKKGE